MTYEQRRRALIFGVIFIILFLIALFWLGLRSGKEGETPEQKTVIENNLLESSEPLFADEGFREIIEEPAFVQEPVVLKPVFSEVRRTAIIFAERYGSFSSQSDFQNLRDSMYLATESMKSRMNEIINTNQKGLSETQDYFGITTQVLSDEILEGNPGDEVVKMQLTTQRTESSGDAGEEEKYYQNLELELMKINGQWFVNNAIWKEKVAN